MLEIPVYIGVAIYKEYKGVLALCGVVTESLFNMLKY